MEFTGVTAEYYKKLDLSPERQEFYGRLDRKHTAPLWEVLAKIIPPAPTPETVPACWRYDEVRPLLMERAPHGHRGRAPRARTGEPRRSRPVADHAEPLQRTADDPSR